MSLFSNAGLELDNKAGGQSIVFPIQVKMMCQMKVVLDQDGERKKIMDNVIRLQSDADGVKISRMFEPPEVLAATRVKEIDFLDGVVVLVGTNYES